MPKLKSKDHVPPLELLKLKADLVELFSLNPFGTLSPKDVVTFNQQLEDAITRETYVNYDMQEIDKLIQDIKSEVDKVTYEHVRNHLDALRSNVVKIVMSRLQFSRNHLLVTKGDVHQFFDRVESFFHTEGMFDRLCENVKVDLHTYIKTIRRTTPQQPKLLNPPRETLTLGNKRKSS